MKCNKCGAKWEVDVSRSASIKICPFCQESLGDKPIGSGWKTFDSTEELLPHIASKYGVDKLFNPTLLKAYLSEERVTSGATVA